MKKREALHIVEIVSETYNMPFDEKKIDIWISVLTKEGDYNQSLKKLYNFIKQSKYKPTVSDVLAIKPKTFVPDKVPVEETHQYKLEHDPAYKKEYEEVRDKARAFIKELRSND
ncbi:hypothetical protein TP70_02240 [Staphylococcus microti]|uniref:Phage protein n=1 Tax=Staphylococcus microti TaxID=569857 RepID=A0A0D6XUD9_9STAP|nr:hypothetical protein [Staphylococcus microti]KIX91453.1 hypothetical protein TP70_02240 [Staphylococcus microti]PNZ82482.1 hypothetical protein CD132_04080 [Staphylococcus microti]PNZ83667.1 hypothetical protein CD132_01950 [Staphylococcus microti]SUM57028.1 phage protein [Staphylococcus microti]